MKLANLFRYFRKPKAPPTPLFWVYRRYNSLKGALDCFVVEDPPNASTAAAHACVTAFRPQLEPSATRYAELLNAGLIGCSRAEASALTAVLSAVRMGELIFLNGPELYEMPPAQDKQFDPPQPVPAEQLKKDLYAGSPFHTEQSAPIYELGDPNRYWTLSPEERAKRQSELSDLGARYTDASPLPEKVEPLEPTPEQAELGERINAAILEVAKPYEGVELTPAVANQLINDVRIRLSELGVDDYNVWIGPDGGLQVSADIHTPGLPGDGITINKSTTF